MTPVSSLFLLLVLGQPEKVESRFEQVHPVPAKKEKSGFYITVNFFNQTLTLMRFGWIDADDWDPQEAPTGQMAGLKQAEVTPSSCPASTIGRPEPSALAVQTSLCRPPSAKAIRLPSGDQAGFSSGRRVLVSGRTEEPSVLIT